MSSIEHTTKYDARQRTPYELERIRRRGDQNICICPYMPHSYWAYCGQGYVYIAVHEATYKIGCAMIGGRAEAVYTSWGELAGVRSRMNALRKQTRKPFRLLHLIYTPVCVKGVEAFIHSQLDDSRRGKREHFMLDAYDLDWLFSLDTFDGYPLTHMEADVCPGE